MKQRPIPGIYLIIHVASGRVYVGQARNVAKRWYFHRWYLARGEHNNRHLQRAWDKHGPDAFEFVLVSDLSAIPETGLAEVLNLEEARVFARYTNTFNLMQPGLEGATVPEETREKLSIARKRVWQDALAANPLAAKEHMEAAHAWARTPIGKAAISARSKALWTNPTHRAAMAVVGSEKWNRPGFRENHHRQLKAAWQDDEKREQRVRGLRSAWANPEIRAARLEAIRIGQAKAMEDPNGKMRKRPEKRWADPEARTRAAEKAKSQWADPEARKRKTDALKAAWARRKATKAIASLPLQDAEGRSCDARQPTPPSTGSRRPACVA